MITPVHNNLFDFCTVTNIIIILTQIHYQQLILATTCASAVIRGVMCHERANRKRDMQQAKQQQESKLLHQLESFVSKETNDAIKEETESDINEFVVAEAATNAVAE